MYIAFSAILFSLLQLVISDSFTIDKIPLCPLVEPTSDTEFSCLMPFFYCNRTIKEKKILTEEIEHAEHANSRDIRNTAFHYQYNFFERSYNWTENHWSIRLAGGLKINGIDAEFVETSRFECIADRFAI